jgi:hypothetical protein
MAKSKLINCGTCNEEMARSAKICPKCGAKNKKRPKTGCAVVLITLGVLWMIADGMKGANSSQEVFQMNEPALVNDAEWIVTNAKLIDQGSHNVVKISGELTNRGSDARGFSKDLCIVDSDGNEYGANDDEDLEDAMGNALASAFGGESKELWESINPEISVSFRARFDVPKTATGLMFAGKAYNTFSGKRVLIDLGLDDSAVSTNDVSNMVIPEGARGSLL